MARKSKRKKVRKFKEVNFKLTSNQKKVVDAFCRKHNTTPVTMYKKAIATYLKNNGYGNYKDLYHPQAVNQMTIFDLLEDTIEKIAAG